MLRRFLVDSQLPSLWQQGTCLLPPLPISSSSSVSLFSQEKLAFDLVKTKANTSVSLAQKSHLDGSACAFEGWDLKHPWTTSSFPLETSLPWHPHQGASLCVLRVDHGRWVPLGLRLCVTCFQLGSWVQVVQWTQQRNSSLSGAREAQSQAVVQPAWSEELGLV